MSSRVGHSTALRTSYQLPAALTRVVLAEASDKSCSFHWGLWLFNHDHAGHYSALKYWIPGSLATGNARQFNPLKQIYTLHSSIDPVSSIKLLE